MKLSLVGLIPLVLLVYLSLELFSEHKRNLDLLRGYIGRIHQSADLNALSNELQAERRHSIQFALTGEEAMEMNLQRMRTDSMLRSLESKYAETLGNFATYTFLSPFGQFREAIDSRKASADAIMHYFTSAVLRLNTMNTIPVVTNAHLEPVFQDLVTQKILSEMGTYLAVVRTNIYNALYTQRNIMETLRATKGVYDVYRTYEKEFFEKASPIRKRGFDSIRRSPELQATTQYIDSLFQTFEPGGRYDAHTWWAVSLAGVQQLRSFQKYIVDHVEREISSIYRKQKQSRNAAVVVIGLMVLGGIGVIIFVIRNLTIMLGELDRAAQRIAAGGTGVHLEKASDDIIGRLSESILRIEKANRALAEAAEAIGKGNFGVPVEPRSRGDVLGNAIIRMKKDLQHFTNEMKELEKRKDNFIKMASHELKTPITSIKGYVQLLLQLINDRTSRNEELPRPLLLTSLLTIDKQISRLTRLIGELLDLSRVETGQFEMNMEHFNLNELVMETVKELQQTTSHHLISFESSSQVMIYGDRDRLGQVITNLLTNAIKYSPASDRIEVQLHPTGEEVAVTIRDYGIGIEKPEQHKIFERFYRAEGEQEKTFPGFGIGLFIASEIVQRHDGKIRVESEPGKGSVFTVLLPLSLPKPQLSTTVKRAGGSPGSKHAHS